MISHEDKGNDPSTGKMRVPSMSPHEDNGAKLRLEKRRALAMLSHERVKCDRATRKKLRAPTTMSPSLTLARKIPRDAWPGRAVVCSPSSSNTGAPWTLDRVWAIGEFDTPRKVHRAPPQGPRPVNQLMVSESGLRFEGTHPSSRQPSGTFRERA